MQRRLDASLRVGCGIIQDMKKVTDENIQRIRQEQRNNSPLLAVREYKMST